MVTAAAFQGLILRATGDVVVEEVAPVAARAAADRELWWGKSFDI